MMDSELAVLFAKPIAVAAVATAANQWITPGFGLQYSATFGASIGAGVLVADVIGSKMGQGGSVVSKSIENRVMELSLGVGSGLAVHKYILGQDYYGFPQRALIAAGSEVAGEWLSNSFLGVR